MAISNTIFRCVKHILKDGAFHKTSEWQLAKDVECDDGTNVESKLTSLNSSVASCLKSVSDGKSAVASAITAQGVSTAADAAFSTMAANIGKVGSAKYNAGVAAAKKGTAGAARVLSGYTFTNTSSVGASGTMTNRGAWTGSTPANTGNITIPAGYHNGSGYVSGKQSYNAGVTAADARVNTASANYKGGYNAGYSAGVTAGDKAVQRKAATITLNSADGYQTINFGMTFSKVPNVAITLNGYAGHNRNGSIVISSRSTTGFTVYFLSGDILSATWVAWV